MDTDAIRRAKKALAENDDSALNNWPKNRFGVPRLIVSRATADRFIAAGVAVEDDLIIQEPLPTSIRRDRRAE